MATVAQRRKGGPVSARAPWGRLVSPLAVTLLALVIPLCVSAFAYASHSYYFNLTTNLSTISPEAYSANYRAQLQWKTFGDFALFTGLLVPLTLLHSATHEWGHILAGRMVGLYPVMVVTGPLRVSFTKGGARIRQNREWRGYMGAALSVPPDGRNVRRRYALMAAGGPTASLALCLLALYLGSTLFPNRADTFVGSGLFSVLAFLSFFGFVVNARPSWVGEVLTDGAQVKMLFGSNPVGERWSALLALTAASERGLRPKEWHVAWIEAATAHLNGSPNDLRASHFALYWALDRGAVEEAGEYLRRAIVATRRSALPATAGIISLEAAFYHAYFLSDRQAARNALLEAGDMLGSHYLYMRLRAEAAILLLEGKVRESQEKAVDGMAALEAGGPYFKGALELEREWLRKLSGS